MRRRSRAGLTHRFIHPDPLLQAPHLHRDAHHLALGAGFPDTVEGFEHRTLEECRALGVNDSILHEDFMIGTADLSIDAETFDGKTVPIFRNGVWAF